jgi:hypothetical protein
MLKGRALPVAVAAFCPSHPLTTILFVNDYAGAWTAERGGCHRLLYDPDGKPTGCPAIPVASGWRQDYQGRWYPVGACAGHAGQLVARPSRQAPPK